MKLTLGLLLAAAAAAAGQTPTPVAHLDIDKYVGKWYEIAAYPVKAEKKCVSDPFWLFAEGDKPRRVEIVTSCRLQDGSVDVHNKDAVQDKSGDGRLNIRTIFPFTTKYWVFAVAPDYQWALVGNPNKKTLWIMARGETLTPEVMDQIKAEAAKHGFDVGKLVLMKQGL
jgi:apolipoprotein D and lipocalin family protein